MWDEARRHHQPGRRHRNIFAGAVGVILTGWLIYGLGLSCSVPLGGILMLGGALIGVWHYMKFRRRQRHSPEKFKVQSSKFKVNVVGAHCAPAVGCGWAEGP